MGTGTGKKQPGYEIPGCRGHRGPGVFSTGTNIRKYHGQHEFWWEGFKNNIISILIIISQPSLRKKYLSSDI